MEDSIFLPTGTEGNSEIMYGTANFYSFFRHFHCLYERLIKARALAGKELEAELEKKSELLSKYSDLIAKKKEELKGERYEQIYLKGLYSLLGSNIDAA